MEIRHMRITNFRGLKSADFTPEKLNVFLGASGSGKSSILDALRYGTGYRSEDLQRLLPPYGEPPLEIFMVH